MHHLKRNSGLPEVTIWGNWSKGYPLGSTKSLDKAGKGSFDYWVDSNFGLIVVKWMNNSIVQLVSILQVLSPSKQWPDVQEGKGKTQHHLAIHSEENEKYWLR